MLLRACLAALKSALVGLVRHGSLTTTLVSGAAHAAGVLFARPSVSARWRLVWYIPCINTSCPVASTHREPFFVFVVLLVVVVVVIGCCINTCYPSLGGHMCCCVLVVSTAAVMGAGVRLRFPFFRSLPQRVLQLVPCVLCLQCVVANTPLLLFVVLTCSSSSSSV